MISHWLMTRQITSSEDLVITQLFDDSTTDPITTLVCDSNSQRSIFLMVLPKMEIRKHNLKYEGNCINDFGNYHLRMELPVFDGQMHIEDFLDHMEIPKAKKVKLVALRLKGWASDWWDQTTMNKAKFQKSPVHTWEGYSFSDFFQWILNAYYLPSINNANKNIEQ